MDKETMRRADFKTGIILAVLSVLILAETLTFPMTDSYGGVQNVWYVSPALLPLILGGVLLALALVLLANAIREGGHRSASGFSLKGLLNPSEHTVRFSAIILYLLAYVYVFVPYVDFILATFLFLFPFALSFYLDRHDILKKMALLTLAVSAVMVVLLLTRIWHGVVEGFEYAFDIPLLAFAVGLTVYARKLADTDPLLARRFRITLIVAVASPLILFLCFRYGLKVQMPYEGVIVDAFESVRYFFRR